MKTIAALILMLTTTVVDDRFVVFEEGQHTLIVDRNSFIKFDVKDGEVFSAEVANHQGIFRANVLRKQCLQKEGKAILSSRDGSEVFGYTEYGPNHDKLQTAVSLYIGSLGLTYNKRI